MKEFPVWENQSSDTVRTGSTAFTTKEGTVGKEKGREYDRSR